MGTKKEFVDGVDRAIHFLWENVTSAPFSRCATNDMSQTLPGDDPKEYRQRLTSYRQEEVYVDLCHHLQSIGVEEVVSIMTTTLTEGHFCNPRHSKYPCLRFATWDAYGDISQIRLYYEDFSRQNRSLGELAETKVLSPSVLQVTCKEEAGRRAHGIGGPDFVRDQLSRHCLIPGPQEAELTMEFVLPEASDDEIAQQLAIGMSRRLEIQTTLESLYGNTRVLLDHAMTHALNLSDTEKEILDQERRGDWESELSVRQQMASLLGKSESESSMVQECVTAMEKDLALNEVERVQSASSTLEKGYCDARERLQHLWSTIHSKITGFCDRHEGLPQTNNMKVMSM